MNIPVQLVLLSSMFLGISNPTELQIDAGYEFSRPLLDSSLPYPGGEYIDRYVELVAFSKVSDSDKARRLSNLVYFEIMNGNNDRAIELLMKSLGLEIQEEMIRIALYLSIFDESLLDRVRSLEHINSFCFDRSTMKIWSELISGNELRLRPRGFVDFDKLLDWNEEDIYDTEALNGVIEGIIEEMDARLEGRRGKSKKRVEGIKIDVFEFNLWFGYVLNKIHLDSTRLLELYDAYLYAIRQVHGIVLDDAIVYGSHRIRNTQKCLQGFYFFYLAAKETGSDDVYFSVLDHVGKIRRFASERSFIFQMEDKFFDEMLNECVNTEVRGNPKGSNAISKD